MGVWKDRPHIHVHNRFKPKLALASLPCGRPCRRLRAPRQPDHPAGPGDDSGCDGLHGALRQEPALLPVIAWNERRRYCATPRLNIQKHEVLQYNINIVGSLHHDYNLIRICEQSENRDPDFLPGLWVRSLLTVGLWRRLNNRWHGTGMGRYGARCRPHTCKVTALWVQSKKSGCPFEI